MWGGIRFALRGIAAGGKEAFCLQWKPEASAEQKRALSHQASASLRIFPLLASIALVLLCASTAAAQVQVGEVSTTLSGVISVGYSADYGSDISSSHSLGFSGSATASGYYYNPNFVSFTLSPYYGQSRANSTSQSIASSSGFDFSTNIFSGSHFPGSISYARAYDSTSQFAVPGLPNFTTHGNDDTFGITWSEFLPDRPTLTASFQRGSNEYSVYGVSGNGSSNFHSFSLNSNYTLEGFNLGASYTTGTSHSFVPPVFEGGESQNINTDNSGFGVTASHSLPLRGNFSTSFYRSDINTDYFGYQYKGNFDTAFANVGIQPTDKLHVSVGASYTDNLAGILFQSVPSGSTLFPANNLGSSHSWDLNAAASYSLAANLSLQATADRREQAYLGENFGSTSYSAGVSYARGLLGGAFNTSLSFIDSTADNIAGNTLGFSTTVNYSRRIGRWFVTGGFNYNQNVQSLLVTYLSSNYGYSASVRRRFGIFNWTAGATFAHSGLTNQPGTNSHSESYNTSIGYGRWISLNANYAKANGVGVITGGGIVPVTLPGTLPGTSPSELITLYGGTNYGFGLGSTPTKHLTLSASFTKTSSNTMSAGIFSGNHFESANAQFTYRFRKINLNGGYANLKQGFSTSGLPPASVSSYYIGISRWFNFF